MANNNHTHKTIPQSFWKESIRISQNSKKFDPVHDRLENEKFNSIYKNVSVAYR